MSYIWFLVFGIMRDLNAANSPFAVSHLQNKIKWLLSTSLSHILQLQQLLILCMKTTKELTVLLALLYSSLFLEVLWDCQVCVCQPFYTKMQNPREGLLWGGGSKSRQSGKHEKYIINWLSTKVTHCKRRNTEKSICIMKYNEIHNNITLACNTHKCT